MSKGGWSGSGGQRGDEKNGEGKKQARGEGGVRAKVAEENKRGRRNKK